MTLRDGIVEGMGYDPAKHRRPSIGWILRWDILQAFKRYLIRKRDRQKEAK